MGGVKVLLRNPRRELEMPGAMQVSTLLNRLDINRESVIVIRGGTVVPGDAWLDHEDDIEIRPVISGGDFGPVVARSRPWLGSKETVR